MSAIDTSSLLSMFCGHLLEHGGELRFGLLAFPFPLGSVFYGSPPPDGRPPATFPPSTSPARRRSCDGANARRRPSRDPFGNRANTSGGLPEPMRGGSPVEAMPRPVIFSCSTSVHRQFVAVSFYLIDLWSCVRAQPVPFGLPSSAWYATPYFQPSPGTGARRLFLLLPFNATGSRWPQPSFTSRARLGIFPVSSVCSSSS